MAEPEDLLSDAARHATIYTRRMWRRYRPLPVGPPTALLADVAPRLDLLITAITGHSYTIRTAQHPAHPTFLSRLFGRVQTPWLQQALPATNGRYLWLPADSDIADIERGNELYRVMALQQALRAQRGSAEPGTIFNSPLQQDVYLLLEAWATDAELIRQLPGMHDSVQRLRQHALQSRPPLASFSKARQPLELWLRQLLTGAMTDSSLPLSTKPAQSAWLAEELIERLQLLPALLKTQQTVEKTLGGAPLLKDWWTGELRTPNLAKASQHSDQGEPAGRRSLWSQSTHR